MKTMDLRNRFEYHPPQTQTKVDAHQAIRKACLEAAMIVDSVTPECREQSLAVTKLEEAMFWANAAIARYP